MKFNFVTSLAILANCVFAADETNSTTTTSRSTSTTTNSNSRSTSSSSNTCSFSRTTITNATALQELTSCPTLDGEITISGNEFASIDLPQLREIAGDVTVINSRSIVAINLNQLRSIDGKLTITNMTQLNTIDLSSLRNSRDLELVSLPSFANLVLNSELESAGKVVLSDTALTNLNGLTSFNNIQYMNINNNKNITQIQFPNLKSVTDALILSFNNDDAVVELNDLEWAANLTIQSVGQLSASELRAINGTLQISYNLFESLNLSTLTYVGSSLQVFAHDELTSIDFKNLQEIGGELSLFNNSDLHDLQNSFPNLEVIEGAVAISGDIANLSMSKLEKVRGDFQLNSTSEDFDCSEFDQLHDDGDIEGNNYICSTAVDEDELQSATGTTTRSGSTSTSTGSSSGEDDSPNRSNGADKLVISSLFMHIGLILAISLL
ncbi:Ecm331 GPI-anchored protein [Candida orthopsilosis Co 90-125]|uniref:Ecm331 GPI-anchored protein n=1 Tax=Candida orthopsilosis (strain 90-125) TaxID=1136231 RepID=H8X913_CANO9|nr:Ecm331 GPI-anchored protein [Candida orthopsilosis Co 90-125]CCG24311.1 Ecm331 GPI-anchored protein [Candida orthopsilosis Co 90-125]